MIEMETRGPPITERDIEQVERNLGIRFPDDYRAFLLAVNGGRPAQSNIVFSFRQSTNAICTLFGILKEGDGQHGIREQGEIYNLEDEARRGWNDNLHIPETLMPIGDDDYGDFICLGVAGNEQGKVYFRDSERVPGEQPTKEWTRMKGIYRIADSFSEFLASLRPDDAI